MKEKKKDEFFKIFNSTGKKHFKKLYLINKKKFIKGCGSYLFNGYKYIYDESMYEKQKLLFELCKTNKKILEIGSYMGHSILIMLLSNPKIHITAIDINDYYSKPSLDYLQKKFPDSKINFIKSDSIKALSRLKEKFDLFHVDGTHEHEMISKEFQFLLNLRKKNKVKILFDDAWSMPYLKKNILKSFKILKNITPNSYAANFYVEIYINNKLFKKNLKDFKIENLKIFFKYRMLKLFLKILFFNKIVRRFYRSYFKNFKISKIIKEKLIFFLNYENTQLKIRFKK